MIKYILPGNRQVIRLHSFAIGLKDGFQVVRIKFLFLDFVFQVVTQQGVGAVSIDTGHFIEVETDEVVSPDVLGYLHPVHRPGFFGSGVEQVLPESDVGAVVAQVSEQGGHDVDLLGDAVPAADGHFAGGVEEEDGDAEPSERGLVFGMGGAAAGVVGGEHEDGVFVPWLAGGGFKETAERMVRVTDALVQGIQPLVGEGVPVLLGKGKRVMRGSGEDGGEERLFHFIHLQAEVLQVGFIPNRPGAVEVLFTAEAGVFVVFRAPEIVVEADGAGERLEAHGFVFGTMEKGGVIAPVFQFGRQAVEPVKGEGGDDIGLVHAGNGCQHGGHGVDGKITVAEGAAEGEAALQQRVGERGVTGIRATVEVSVERADKFPGKAFHDENHHVFLAHGEGVGGNVERRIKEVELCAVFEVSGGGKRFGGQGTQDGEGGIEDNAGLNGTPHILMGVIDGDRAGGGGERTAAHTENGQKNKDDQPKGAGEVVSPEGVPRGYGTGMAVAPDKEKYHERRQQDEVPMAEDFHAEDFQ